MVQKHPFLFAEIHPFYFTAYSGFARKVSLALIECV
jgi:hypothetical protein